VYWRVYIFSHAKHEPPPEGEVAKRSFAYEFGCAKRVLLSKPEALMRLGCRASRATLLLLRGLEIRLEITEPQTSSVILGLF